MEEYEYNQKLKASNRWIVVFAIAAFASIGLNWYLVDRNLEVEVRNDHLLDQWIDQDAQITKLRAAVETVCGETPKMPRVNADPFEAKPEEYKL